METDTAMSTALALSKALHADDPAEVAAAGFLARYTGRALESYRYDLRVFFQWTSDANIDVLDAARAHIELYRRHLEGRGLAGTTISRRLSTLCGYYRFAHIDGYITANPAQYVRRVRVEPPEGRGLDRSELARLLFAAERADHHHAALTMLLGLNGLRVSEACQTDVADLGTDRGHRTLRIIGKGNKPAVIPIVPRTARTIDLARGERTDGPLLLRSDGARLDGEPPIDGSGRWPVEPASDRFIPTCCGPRSSWRRSTPASRCATCSSLPDTPIPAPPRSTTGAAPTSTTTPPTSYPPSSPAADQPERLGYPTSISGGPIGPFARVFAGDQS
jgi:integrase/recombinase XerD